MVQGVALQPVIKLTSECSLRCSYCYQDGLGRPGRLEPVLLERILSEFARVSRKPLSILWYGGEPTGIGLARFRACLEMAEEKVGPGLVRHSLQTNGVRLDREWGELLHRHQVAVTLSLDGPARIHDLQRPRASGEGSHSLVVNGLKALLAAGLNPRVSCVVTQATLGAEDELLGYFWDLGVRELDFPPALRFVDGQVENWVTAEQYGNFMAGIFRAWLARGLTSLRVRSLTGIIRRLGGLPGNNCKLQGDCSSYLTVASDGKVYACDEFSSLPGYCLGDLSRESLEQILASEARRELLTRWWTPPPGCSGCDWVEACPGGCPFERQASGGPEQVSYLCESWKILIPELAQAISPRPA